MTAEADDPTTERERGRVEVTTAVEAVANMIDDRGEVDAALALSDEYRAGRADAYGAAAAWVRDVLADPAATLAQHEQEVREKVAWEILAMKASGMYDDLAVEEAARIAQGGTA